MGHLHDQALLHFPTGLGRFQIKYAQTTIGLSNEHSALTISVSEQVKSCQSMLLYELHRGNCSWKKDGSEAAIVYIIHSDRINDYNPVIVINPQSLVGDVGDVLLD